MGNRIIIEGCDGTGKTTLAKILANEYGLDYCHCTASDPGDYSFYLNTARKDNTVWDRHTIGELIYPEIFDRPPQISIEDARLALAYAREQGAKIFVLTTDMDVIRDRLNKRGGENEKIMRNLEFINDRFIFYAREFKIPVIDTSKLTLGEIFRLVDDYPSLKFIH